MADKIDKRVFAEMEYATADKTSVDLLGDKPRVTKDDVHDMLMAAGFTPGLGNVADAADALLYLTEGKFGEAALSAAAMIPIAGQMVSAKKALQVARKSGKTKKIYRGTTDWHRKEMVREGMHVSPEKVFKYSDTSNPSKKGVWASEDIEEAAGFRERGDGFGRGPLLEYEVPQDWYDKHLSAWNDPDNLSYAAPGWFEGGIPKGFLTKVHKGTKESF